MMLPRMVRIPRLGLCLAAAAWLAACAPGKPVVEDGVRTPMDRQLARLVSKGELDKAQRLADSLTASRDPTGSSNDSATT